ncbi:MAG: hypothetical protein AAF564_18060 [Bacteroidota bacterium]
MRSVAGWFLLVVGLTASCLVAPPVVAQSAQRIVPPDGAVNDQFGVSVAHSGETLLVGANAHDAAGEDAGAVYFYQQNGTNWDFVQKVLVSEGAPADGFGIAVAVDGDYAVVGALGDDERAENAGAVFVYLRENDSWQFLQKLTADDARANDAFGFSVALTDPYLIVGARGADDKGNSAGAAYIFQRAGATWVQLPKLTANDGTSGDFFGTAVDIDARFAVVGAELAEGEVLGSGAVYVFENRGLLWLQRDRLQAADGAFLDQFGAAVSLGETHILVGARANDAGAVDAGAAYLFEERADAFVEAAKLQGADATANSFFGHSVAMRRGESVFALIGAPGNDTAGAEAGAAYVFEPVDGVWQQAGQLLPVDNQPESEMGIAVATADGYALAGSWRDGSAGLESGSVFAFDLRNVLTSNTPETTTPNAHAIRLHAPYPNPFSEQVILPGVLATFSDVEAKVFDVRGRQVATLMHRQTLQPGRVELLWDGRDAAGRMQAPGVYFLVIITASGRQVVVVAKSS